MSGLTHMTGGVLLGSTVIYLVQNSGCEADIAVSAILAGCITGSIICDADEPESIIGRKLWPVSMLFRSIHWIFRILAFLLPKRSKLRRNFADISWAFAHRGMMHWPLTVFIVSVILIFIGHVVSQRIGPATSEVASNLVTGIVIGMISHLIYDMMSGKIALFAPFSKKRIGRKFIESNGFIDKYIVRTLSIAGSVYLLALV